MAVKQKVVQGGGLGPVVGGEDHLPVEGEVTHFISILNIEHISHLVDNAGTTYCSFH